MVVYSAVGWGVVRCTLKALHYRLPEHCLFRSNQHTHMSRAHFSKSHRHTEPSAAHEARLRTEGVRERVDFGWNTMAPTRSLCPRSVLTSSQFGTFHSLQRPLLSKERERYL